MVPRGLALDFRAASSLDTLHGLAHSHRNNRAAKRPECSGRALGQDMFSMKLL
jgi:hypothetical protein